MIANLAEAVNIYKNRTSTTEHFRIGGKRFYHLTILVVSLGTLKGPLAFVEEVP